ncbi:hypothetical protein KKC74_09580 [bacterium]|nr:hypothetical protein [bacterium]MBU1065038.1 hypothetical protein [bacterium]
MKPLINKLVLFLIGLIFINTVMFLVFTYPVFYKYYKVPLNTLAHYSKFLFGDSHVWVIHQNYLNNYGIHNFSYGSDSYIDIFSKLNCLYNQGVHIDTVFITADDHTLSLYRETLNNKHRSVIYADKNTYRRYYRRNKLLYYPDKYIRRYLPLFEISNSQIFVRYLASRLIPSKYTSENNYQSWADYPDKEMACRQRKTDQFSSNKVSGQLSDCLIEIVDLCRQNGTVVIGIKFPLSKDYINCIGDMNYGADNLLLEQNVSLFDLKQVFIDHDDYFFDQDHLNDRGVIKFVEMLTKL